jgi:hypothetical protein
MEFIGSANSPHSGPTHRLSMTNTDGTSPARKPARSKKNATATEPATTASAATTPVAETVAAPVAPAGTTVVERRSGIGRGILIGAIAAALVGGIALGGGAGALIATAASHHGRPDFTQSQGGQLGGPGQQGPGGQGAQGGHGQNGPGQSGGGMPAQPPQGGQTPEGGDDTSTDGE